MSFNIQIANHIPGQTVYHVGDTIEGVLELNGPIKDNKLIVSLYLRGFSWTRIELGKHTALDTATLFSIRREFFRGPINLEAGSHLNWQFSFVFQDRTSADREYHNEYPWISEVHEPPPSVNVQSILYGGSLGYELFAQAHKSTFFSIDVRNRAAIPFRKRQPEGLLLPVLQHQTTDLTMRLPIVESRPSFASWVKRCLRLDKREVQMTIRAQIPQRMELGKITPLELELLPNDASAFTAMPPVYLLSIRHTIQSRTCVRLAMTRSWNLSNYKKKNACFKFKDNERCLPTGEVTDFGRDPGIILPDGLQIPTFQSHNISYIYRSKTVLKVRYGGVTRRLVFKVPILEVLPSERAEQIEQAEEKVEPVMEVREKR